ncbi:MAG: fibronectin type III domain-containing protein [Nocardioidaceae bacterium]|nr:fibronectin type III domain-containing protein [Nocardioidaceae bacterium]
MRPILGVLARLLTTATLVTGLAMAGGPATPPGTGRLVRVAAGVTLPGPPSVTAASAGNHVVTLRWGLPAAAGSSPITGWRLSRDGVDRDGVGPWSQLVPASTRAFRLTDLKDLTTYGVSVAAVTADGAGEPCRVRLTPSRASRVAGAVALTRWAPADGAVALGWRAPTRLGSRPRVTAYRVTLAAAAASRSRRVTTHAAGSRRARLTGLVNGTTYEVRVAPVTKAGVGVWATVRIIPAAPVPAADSLPSPPRLWVDQATSGAPATLRIGGPGGPAARMAGVAVWGVPDWVTGPGWFALTQYRNRDQIAATIQAWGGNHIRLRVRAEDYNTDGQGYTKADRLTIIQAWRDAAAAHGLYLYVSWVDATRGVTGGANWPAHYAEAFPMMTDVYQALGPDDRVFYEPVNEPNNFPDTWTTWATAMRDTVAHWRSLGYTGILIIDLPDYSHTYHDGAMTALEQFDAGQPGMDGRHQLVFARHDYANESWPDGGNTFDPAAWHARTGGTHQRHVIWESEFGNYNGDPATVHPTWSRQASRFFADELDNPERPNFAGATAFLWGPWWDANAMLDADGNPTIWGHTVRDAFLGRAEVTTFGSSEWSQGDSNP